MREIEEGTKSGVVEEERWPRLACHWLFRVVDGINVVEEKHRVVGAAAATASNRLHAFEKW